MAKGQTNSATDKSNELYGNAYSQTQPILGGLQGDKSRAQNRQQGAFDSAYDGYQQQSNLGGFDPGMLGLLRGQSARNAESGGLDTGAFGNVQGDLRDATSRGGYNETTLNYLLGQGKQYGDSGAYSQEQSDTLMSGYGDLAKTGGFTPEKSAQFINASTQGVKSTYENLMNQAQRDKAKTGGLGTSGELSQMARQLSQEQARETLNAQVGLNQQVVQNQLAGLGGISNVAANQAGNRLTALGQLSSTAANQAGNTLSGLGQQGGLLTAQAGLRQGAQGQQIGLESNVASGVQNANAGLAHLYDTSTGEVTALGNQVLSTLGLQFGTQQAAINALTQLSKNPGLFQTILGDILATASTFGPLAA